MQELGRHWAFPSLLRVGAAHHHEQGWQKSAGPLTRVMRQEKNKTWVSPSSSALLGGRGSTLGSGPPSPTGDVRDPRGCLDACTCSALAAFWIALPKQGGDQAA